MNGSATKPTDRQKEVLRFIAGFIDQKGYSPTVREIGVACGISSPNGVMGHLRALRKKGFIESPVGPLGRSLARCMSVVKRRKDLEPLAACRCG